MTVVGIFGFPLSVVRVVGGAGRLSPASSSPASAASRRSTTASSRRSVTRSSAWRVEVRRVIRTSSVARRRFSTTTTSSWRVTTVVSPSCRTGTGASIQRSSGTALDLDLLDGERRVDDLLGRPDLGPHPHRARDLPVLADHGPLLDHRHGHPLLRGRLRHLGRLLLSEPNAPRCGMFRCVAAKAGPGPNPGSGRGLRPRPCPCRGRRRRGPPPSG